MTKKDFQQWCLTWESFFDAINRNIVGPYTPVDVLINRTTGELLVAPRHRLGERH